MHDQPTNNANMNTTPTRQPISLRWPRLHYVDQNRKASQWQSITEELRRGNFVGCEFSIEQGQSSSLLEQWQGLIQRVDDSPLSVHGVEIRLTHGDVRKTQDGLNAALRCFRMSNYRHLNLVMPAFNQSNSAESGCINRYQDLLNFAQAVLRGVRFEAEASGIAIGLVAGAHGCFLSPVEVREMIDAIGSWSVGACLDEMHLQHGPSFEDWIATLGPRTKALRLKSEKLSDIHGVDLENEAVRCGKIERLLEEAHFDGAIVIRETQPLT